jgi:glycosyltransferase involved in cell wall biosynthesis
LNWEEPFGLTTIEAMACGTPVVARPMGALPEVVADGETGFLRHSSEDLTTALRETLAGAIDPSACRARVEREFSGPAMGAKYEALFGRVLG